jgi:small-conductance mechanosensitive channel
LLTALGVGSLAVALALQDTLSNFFSGFYIILSKHIRVGDYIRLDAGQEGYVEDVAWRLSKLRDLAGNLVLVPNNKLAQATVTNTSRPVRDMTVVVHAVVAAGSDLEKVERVSRETAEEVMKQVEGGMPDFHPAVRYHDFDAAGIRFDVVLQSSEYTTQYVVKHEFIKRLLERFKQEGIALPSPATVNLITEKK